MEDSLKIEFPYDYILKEKVIKSKERAMTNDIEAISSSFTTSMEILHSYKSFTIREPDCPTCQMSSNGKKK